MRHPAGETVTVTRKGEPTGDDDEQGNPIIGPDTTFDIDGVAVAPSGSAGGGNTFENAAVYGPVVITGYTLFLPSGTVLLSTDRLTIRGEAGWQVEGDPTAGQWTSPFTGDGMGVQATVKRAS